MIWRDTLELPSITTTYDDYGAPVETETWRTVFCNKKDVRQSEFYQSLAVGLKPSKMFEIREIEYDDEQKARYGDVEYYIVRTFSKNGEILEIVLSKYPMEG